MIFKAGDRVKIKEPLRSDLGPMVDEICTVDYVMEYVVGTWGVGLRFDSGGPGIAVSPSDIELYTGLDRATEKANK